MLVQIQATVTNADPRQKVIMLETRVGLGAHLHNIRQTVLEIASEKDYFPVPAYHSPCINVWITGFRSGTKVRRD